MTLELIDKQDSFEIVRDQIGAILTLEIASQQLLAEAAAKDPADWKIRVFEERSNPWEQFLNEDDESTPIVNVWYDHSTFDPAGSNVVERQKATAIYNIDCYGRGTSTNIKGGGHTPGDKDAAFEVQRALRLVRNILMAGEYTYLALQGLVWQRWSQTGTVFQPQQGDVSVQNIVGARLELAVTFNEFSPQVAAETLEFLSVDVKRIEDGEIVVEADYDYTA